ncbi:putative F-box domain-containing protein [Rosa chinensis]|uniref:Putative F-box domain-containing protein n=1 Tax=Rosa chinensis TaxID=74649 RepID=A0A2P6PVJ6_ROSCH|nr:putative F-box domain-containing protein [Rosa chinensis]
MLSLEDFTSFGAVCKSWRSVATREVFNSKRLGPTHQAPFLILSKKEASAIRMFYNFRTGKICKLYLPETENKLCYSSLGWLGTVSKHMRIVAPDMPGEILGRPNLHYIYLVESAGTLLAVLCFGNKYAENLTTGFRIFEVPFGNGKSWWSSDIKLGK